MGQAARNLQFSGAGSRFILSGSACRSRVEVLNKQTHSNFRGEIMTSKVSALVLSIALALVWATAASAQWARYPITGGSVQYQIGDGLPIPILTGAQAIPGALIRQPIAGADPRPLQLIPGQFTHPGTPFTLALFNNNSAVFQVRTAIPIDFPVAYANLLPGGRTGAPVVSFCAGSDVTATGNPGCAGPGAGSGINGLLRYTSTANQFGGPARGFAGGSADVALNPGVPTVPCDYAVNPGCQVIFALATPAGTGAQGATFNAKVSTSGAAPSPGLFNAVIGAGGAIASVTPTGIAPGLPNPATSYGAPWTTGMLTVQNTAAFGSPETFVLSGSDNRVSGVGTISLVAGSTSDRGISGPNANRGWLTITIGDVTGTPALSTWGIGALAVVLAGAAVRRLRKA